MLPRLGALNWDRLRVEWVVLFGSLTREGSGRDVDLLVYPGPQPLRSKLDYILGLIESVSTQLGVDPGLVDIVLASEDTPCTIVFDAWKHGKIVYERWRGSARSWLLQRVKICYDYKIMLWRHGIPRRSVEAIKRRWGGA